MSMRHSLTAVALLGLAGCNAVQPLPDHPGATAAIQDYYAGHAWEQGARCTLPSMQVTETTVLDDTPDRLVVEVRYFWQDGRQTEGDFMGFCSGFSTRTFTLANGRVIAMTGEQRP